MGDHRHPTIPKLNFKIVPVKPHKHTLPKMRLLLLLFFSWSCSALNSESQTVYITPTGKKYHRESCRYLRLSKHPITLLDAQKKGYEGCLVCKPFTGVLDEQGVTDSAKITWPSGRIKNVVPQQCSATTRSTGRRCKRMTKSASGKCWQHD